MPVTSFVSRRLNACGFRMETLYDESVFDWKFAPPEVSPVAIAQLHAPTGASGPFVARISTVSTPAGYVVGMIEM